MSTAVEPTLKPVSASAWMKQAFHLVTLPSGAVVKIRIPDIAALIKTGEIPQALLGEAIAAAKGMGQDTEPKAPTAEEMSREVEFKNLVIKATVVEPEITDALLEPKTGMPAEDKDMLVEFAMRQTEFDAIGNQIAGLHTSAQYRKFRGLGGLYEDVEGLPSS